MANALKPKGREAFLAGDAAWDTDTFKIVLVDNTHTEGSGVVNLSDIASGARVATSPALSGKGVTDGWATASNPVFAAVPSGDTITQAYCFRDSGSESTSVLIAYWDTKSDTTPISLATNGLDIEMQFTSSQVFRL